MMGLKQILILATIIGIPTPLFLAPLMPLQDRFTIRLFDRKGREITWVIQYKLSLILPMRSKKESFVVLSKKRTGFQILLKEYLIECDLSLPSGIDLKPEDLVQVKIQHVNARRDVVSVFMG